MDPLETQMLHLEQTSVVSVKMDAAATLDGAHHLELAWAHVTAVGVTPSRAMIAENIRDLQSWSSHGRWRYGAGGFSLSRFERLRRGALRRSRGLSIWAISPVATRQ